MAMMIPETMLEFDPQGREDLVFNALKEGLDGEYWVFHSCAVNQTGANGAFYEKEVRRWRLAAGAAGVWCYGEAAGQQRFGEKRG